MAQIVEPLRAEREAQARTFERYRYTMLTDQAADHAILNMVRERVINLQRIGVVLDEREEPTYDEFRHDKSAWRLFNAATFALNGRIAENPTVTKQLHRVIDGVCEAVH